MRSNLLNILTLAICISSIGCSNPEAAFKKASRENTREAYATFIRTYPKSELCKNAKLQIESLAYEEALRQNTVDAFTKYVAQYNPDASFVRKAHEQISALAFENARTGDALLAVEVG